MKKLTEESEQRATDGRIREMLSPRPAFVSLVRKVRRAVRRVLGGMTSLDLRAARRRLSSIDAQLVEISAVLSLHDSLGQPSERLLDILPALALRARKARLPLLAARGAPSFSFLWPGEHYRLLEAMVQELRPQLVIEIGTQTGLSALAMKPALSNGARLVTVDIKPWNEVQGTYLRHSDFADGDLVQVVCDLGRLEVPKEHADLIRKADLIFVDASHDGALERRLLSNFAAVGLKPNTLLLFDDIKLWSMLSMWREIPHPKIDLTSIGHWSGTGLVEWRVGEYPR